MTDAQVKAALSPLQAVAMTIWAEARAEPVEGQVGVGCVIRNRVLQPGRFGDSWKAVCHARAQFSCWFAYGGALNYALLMRRCEDGLTGALPWPQEALWIAEGVVSGAARDRVGGATHYMTVDLWKQGTVRWAQGLKPVVIVHAHAFFAGVR